MSEPVWLRRTWLDALHHHQVTRFGGLHGVRDSGAIDSALARAQDRWHYGGARDLTVLAAAYGFGLARNHGYSDGNKRIAFVAMGVFLDMNGLELIVEEPDVVETILALADGQMSEEALADWLKSHVVTSGPAREPEG